jgi:hypothetical protein
MSRSYTFFLPSASMACSGTALPAIIIIIIIIMTEVDTRDRDRWRSLVLGEGKPL